MDILPIDEECDVLAKAAVPTLLVDPKSRPFSGRANHANTPLHILACTVA